MNDEEKIIKGLIYSQFDEKIGPVARSWYPKTLSKDYVNKISFKSINLMGGIYEKNADSSAVIPFPDLELKGLVRTFIIKDESKRGKKITSSISLIFSEEDDVIFYKYMNNFEQILSDLVKELTRIEENNEQDNVLAHIENVTKEYFEKLKTILIDLKEEEFSAESLEEFPEPDQEDAEKKIYRFKILVCGDSGVGKTSIILRFTNNAFKKTYIPTLGVNITEKIISFENCIVKFVIWDIAGQNKFKLMRRHYYEGGNGSLIVFDLTRITSFRNVRKWYKDIQNNLEKDIIGLIIGNKADLKDKKSVRNIDIGRLTKSLKLEYIETSALTGQNVNDAFTILAKKLVKKYANEKC
ncbi:MAG: Rab family GTPase [Candidatus Helarchaeota archaeon]